MENIKLQKYKLGGIICKNVFKKLKNKIIKKNVTNVQTLTSLGNTLIMEEYKEQIKNYENLKPLIKNVSVAFPTCISLNNCVGYYIYEPDNNDYNIIKSNDLIKIELGINIDDCINIFGKSFYFTHNIDLQKDKYIKLLDKLENKITKLVNTNSTNIDIQTLIESYCTEYNCFPVENTFSYQHLDQHIQTDDSKYIVTNHCKYYDEYDNLIVNQDISFDLSENDVFTINLTIIPNKEDDNEHIYNELHQPHIYKFNEYYHNFKLGSSKEFYSFIKKTHGFNVFPMTDYYSNVKYRIGLKESLDNGLLIPYPVLYNKEKLPVFFKKFTIIVGKEKGFNLTL